MKNKNFKINFIVFSPAPEYITHIAGIAVTHELVRFLTLLGENAYIYSDTTHPEYNINCIPWGTDISFEDENTILILVSGAGENTYQSYIPENLKKCKNIVRWLVNSQTKLYPEENKLYTNMKFWDTLPSQRIDGYLSILDIDLNLYKDLNQKREGTCYFVKGGLNEEPERAIHNPTDLCLDSVLYNIPNFEKRKFMAQLFNTKEYYIGYNGISFTNIIAALCGCKVIVVPPSYWDKEKLKNDCLFSEEGIAFGVNDLPRAIHTLPQLRPNVEKYLNETQPQQLIKFVEDCYEWLQNKFNI
jgi:hypothetical protein